MAYTVLARKYRSRTFDEVIGQEPIAQTLANAIKTDRVHHGYLFTGTRGSGKTSMARILAKSLNCLSAAGPTTTPCLKCDSCISIAEGQDLDVIEIDAASNTGVDNIRELRSNTAYKPSRSRYKIYIIDEVHMLSTGAFNALLKTLEEPPEHVKFILATTEIQKVPATIQSRCQRFNFRNIGPDAIEKRLAHIVGEEGAKAEAAVLRRIARLANGSMRDALSILDQLMAVSANELSAASLDEVIPPAQDEQVFAVLRSAAAGDAAAALKNLDEILNGGRGLETFCNDAIETIRTLMLLRTCGPDAPMVDIPAGGRDEYAELSRRFELSHYIQMISMLEELKRNVRFSGAGRALADACIVRLAHLLTWTPIEKLIESLPGAAGESAEKKKPLDNQPRPATTTPSAAAVPTPALQRVEPATVPRQRPDENKSGPPAAASAGPMKSAQSPSDRDVPPIDVDETAAGETVYDLPDESEPRSRPAATIERREGSKEDRAKAMQDPVVRQIMELFDGVIVGVDVASQKSASTDGALAEPE